MTTLLLKLAGPLQSYGTDSHFETRQTGRYPSKSAVIGMISASMGLKRHQDKEIQALNQLDFAVRVDQPGKILRDFHTAHALKKDGKVNRTYVTNRYYLEDAVFVVALSGSESLMQEVSRAIKSPYFQPFMGRRALPLTSDFFIEEVEEKPILALTNLVWQAAKWYQKKNANLSKLDIYADADLLSNGSSLMTREHVVSFSQQKRQYGFRPVKHTSIAVRKEDLLQSHDIFSALGGRS